MKKFLTLCTALALTARVAHADTTAPSDAVKKFLAFFDKIVDTVVADQDDCPKMAKDVNALIDANKDVLEAAKKAKAEGKKLPDDARQHMMDASKKMMPGMQKCGKDKDVSAAFQRLDMGPPAKK